MIALSAKSHLALDFIDVNLFDLFMVDSFKASNVFIGFVDFDILNLKKMFEINAHQFSNESYLEMFVYFIK